jgi:L-iditol 2-dehydrogenase
MHSLPEMEAGLSLALPERMKAALFYEPSRVRYEDMPVPELQPGELLIRVETALTCGTDVKCYRRGHPVLLKNFPSPFGHEFAGTVVRILPESPDLEPRFQVGDRVVSANSAPCYQCYLCRKGRVYPRPGPHCKVQYLRHSGACAL